MELNALNKMNEELANQDKIAEEEARHLAGLIAAYIRGRIDARENARLNAWLAESDGNMRLFAQLTRKKERRENLVRLEAFHSGNPSYQVVSSPITDLNLRKPMTGHLNKQLPSPRKPIYAIAIIILIALALLAIIAIS